MARKHLTDEQIQSYLEKKKLNPSRVHPHLNDCALCREQVRQYTNLFSELEKPAHLNLAPNFANSVISRVATETSESYAFQIWQFLIPFLGFASGLGLIFYFMGFKSLVELVRKLGELPEFVGEIFASISALFSGIDFNFGLLGLGICSLILLSALDYFLFRSKERVGSLLK